MFFYKMRNNETIKLEIPESVYEPRDDSLLLAKVLENALEENKIKSVLEIGCGSGLLSIIAAKCGCEVLAADINPKAVECANHNAELNDAPIKTVESNLFDNVEGKFDLIIFNPPYLPEEQNEINKTWAGGENLEIITNFLKGAKEHLESDGKILVAISSLSKPENVLKEFTNNGFDAKIIAERKIPWEKLLVVCVKPDKNI